MASTAFSIPLHVASFWRFGRVVGVGLKEIVSDTLLPIFMVNLPAMAVLQLCVLKFPGIVLIPLWLVMGALGFYGASRLPQVRGLLAAEAAA